MNHARIEFRFLFLSMLLIISAREVFSQQEGTNDNLNRSNILIEGIIKDANTGESVPFSKIKVQYTNSGTTSNSDGFFTINDVPSDTCVLVISSFGYKKTFVDLKNLEVVTNLIIEVEPKVTSFDEVQIKGERKDLVRMNNDGVSSITLNPRELKRLPNVGEKDIMRSFQLMPGITAANESSSGLYVRGGTPDQNLILYDGFTIYHVDHLYGFFSAFNHNALKNVQLHKGGFESKFGGRLSSVTEITGKDGNQKQFNAGGEVSLLSFNVFAELPIGDKFTSVVAFRRSYRGFLYNQIFDQFNDSNSPEAPAQDGPGNFSSQQTTVNSYFYDLNGKFTYKPTSKDIISLSIFNGTDNLDNGFELSTPSNLADAGISIDMSITDLTNYGNFGTALKWSRKWTSKLYGNTVISYSNYYSDRERSSEGSSTNAMGNSLNRSSSIIESNDLKDFSIKSDYQWFVKKNIEIEAGAFAKYFDISYNYTQNDTVSILDRQNYSALFGGYTQSTFKLLDNRLRITPGMRVSYFEITDDIYFEPRASLIYNISENLTFKGAYGKYYQFANRVVREDITSGSRDFWILSDGNDIPVSSSMHYITGFSYETKDYLFNIEGYYKQLTGLSEYSLRFDASFNGVNYNENFYQGSGYSQGIEFMVQKKFGDFSGWASYTLGEARNQFDIYDDDYFPAYQDITHEMNIVAMYNYKRWDFSLTWIYATGRPYTAPSGAYTITLLDGTTQDYFTTTAKNGLRLPDYHRLDASVNYELRTAKREIGYIGVSVFNVYNNTNTWYNQYEIVEGEVIETRINYLGITPNLTLSLKLR